MTTKTQTARPGDVILFEADDFYARGVVTIASGASLTVGAVLGKTATAATVAVAAAGGNTGNGAATLADPAFSGAVKEGVYVLTCIEPASNGGTFSVVGPDGVNVGRAVVGSAYAGPVALTIADGATDFAAGDRFLVTVSAVTYKFKHSAADATDGSVVAAGVLLTDAAAAAADVTGAVALLRGPARINTSHLNWATATNTAAERAACLADLARLGILAD